MSERDTSDRRRVIDALDLTEVVAAAQEENGWTDGQAAAAAGRYRDFLWVVLNSLGERNGNVAAISRSADEVWHQHVLWTRKYRNDCATVFGPGRFLDHIPLYALPRTDADIEVTRQRYRDLGLVPPDDMDADCVWACPG